jgi:two-component sensor histidine kinase
MKICTRLLTGITIVLIQVTLICSTSNAEPMELSPSKEVIAELIKNINRSELNIELVENLLTISRHYLYKDDKEAQQYISLALEISRTLSYNEGLIKSMCIQAGFIKNILNDPESANNVVDNAIILSKKLNLPEMEAYCFYTKSLWFKWTDISTSEESEDYCIKARELFKFLGNKINEAYMVKSLAAIHIGQNKLELALKEIFEALDLYKGANHSKLHYSYNLISAVYKSMGNYEEALKHALLAIKYAEQTRDMADIATFNWEAANLLVILGHASQSIPYFEFLLKNREEDNYNFYFRRGAAVSLSKALIQTGKHQEAVSLYRKIMADYPPTEGSLESRTDEYYLGDIYFSLKQYDEAEKLFLRMLTQNGKSPESESFDLMCFLKLGYFYLSQGNFEKVSEYIEKANNNKMLHSTMDVLNLSFLQFKVDSAFGDYLSAITHYRVNRKLNDSLYNERKSKQIASLNIQFETEKKQQEIVNLTALSREQQAILEKRIFEKKVFITGAIMLLLMLLISVNRYQIKHRANKQLHEQQEIINKNVETLNCLLKEMEELLESKDNLILEKEWLIKEVHHRVKNNLQMISTLLYSQAMYLKDSATIAAFNDIQHRIHAISLIHQKLYQSDNLQLVNMKSYIHELIDNLRESFDTIKEIEFYVEIDALEIGIIKAIPLGLILNEAITNSLKYAFGENKGKKITTLLKRKEDHSILLTIKDNGKGLPTDFNPALSESLGINLMQGLSNQINAEFSIRNENGTLITLKIKEEEEALTEKVI